MDAIDIDAIEADIARGIKAYTELLDNKTADWKRWSFIICGFRGLRDLAMAKAHTSNILSQAYRDEMSRQLQLRKYSVYDRIGGKNAKQLRSVFYKLMDHIEDIDLWYAGLDPDDQLRWKSPDAILKHCPKEYLSSGRGHNKPPKQQGKKKPIVNAEVERLKALLIQVIKRLIKYEPDARDLLDQITPADPSNDVDDLWPDVEEGED
jgi:hypothetical protein